MCGGLSIVESVDFVWVGRGAVECSSVVAFCANVRVICSVFRNLVLGRWGRGVIGAHVGGSVCHWRMEGGRGGRGGIGCRDRGRTTGFRVQSILELVNFDSLEGFFVLDRFGGKVRYGNLELSVSPIRVQLIFSLPKELSCSSWIAILMTRAVDGRLKT